MTLILDIKYGAPPMDDRSLESRKLIVWLRDDCKGIEHYGQPAIVVYYGHKLKTTVHPTRIELHWVDRWAIFPRS